METAVMTSAFGLGFATERENGIGNGRASATDDERLRSPHREMAIDCPTGFFGGKKESPRYPPQPQPQPPPSTSSSVFVERDRSSIASASFCTPAAANAPYVEAPRESEAEERENRERVRRAQEDLRKRREAEERCARDERFLSTSLRDSQKLRRLREKRLDPASYDNPSYVSANHDPVGCDPVSCDPVSCDPASCDPVSCDSGVPALPAKLLDRERLASTISGVQERLRSDADVQATERVGRLLSDERFLRTLEIHNHVVSNSRRLRGPLAAPLAHALVDDVLNATAPRCHECADVRELHELLESAHVSSLLFALDRVACQRVAGFVSTDGAPDDESDPILRRADEYGEESIKVVRLQKTADPLGATVRNEGESVVIGRIVKGGAAEKSGLLHEGDEILEINGVDIRGRSINEVCDIMASLTGTLNFLIIPRVGVAQDDREDVAETSWQQIMHIRCHFSYDPEDDPFIPCRELGISFGKGDVLHVINRSDANWWQAYRDGEDDQALAGLIPSRRFQQQKEAVRQTIVADSARADDKRKVKCHCARKVAKKNKLYNPNVEEAEDGEILTYEEVELYFPQPNRKRPVVLIGPPNVGRHELRQRLMECNQDRFSAAVPHTSRSRRDDELDGRDYHFVARHQFQSAIAKHQFVEYGEFEKNLYGTSIDAIRQVVQSGKTCILNLYPQSLKILKASDMKPFVLFVAPPNLERLKQIRLQQKAKISDEELREIIEKAREIEDKYGHYFNHVIVNYDLDRTYEELLGELNRLEVQPQWVPKAWLES